MKRKRGEHGPAIRLVSNGITREARLAVRRERYKHYRVGRAWVGGMIRREAFLDMHYLKLTWGLRSNLEVIELALQHLAQSARDGTVSLVQDDEAAA